MQRKTAKEILADSLRELASVKSIDKITIRDIVDNCGYSAATFYRHYKDKYDLIAWDYARQIARIMEQIGKNGYTWRQTLMDGLMNYQSGKEYLVNLLTHTSGHDSFVRYMSEVHRRELTAYIKRASGQETVDRQTEMCIQLYCLGTAWLNSEWILGRMDATAQEIADAYEQSIPEPLRPYLTK